MPNGLMWYRPVTGRRQIHVIQRTHPCTDRGGELPLLHDRPQCRCGAGTGPAPRETRRHRASPTDPAHHRGIRRYRGSRGAGASKGDGLGNKFLAHIREVDAIAHVVRCFENDDIVHVAGRIDPANDIEVINTELALADLDSVDRSYQKAVKAAKTSDKDAIRTRDLLERVREQLNKGWPVRSIGLDANARVLLRDMHLLTDKPVMYVANVDETGFTDNPKLDVRELAKAEGSVVVPVCGRSKRRSTA